MTVEGIRVSRRWLSLREPADAAARAHPLVEHLGRRLPRRPSRALIGARPGLSQHTRGTGAEAQVG
ncbi:MAG: hypothetical protein ACJ780_18420 [Solirubrobacteraceae bacterium]